MKIAYYITSHGYGHALRSSVICNKFSRDVELIFRTKVPEVFFRQEVVRPFSYAPAEFDCGCIQTDGVTVDIPRTVAAYSERADKNAVILPDEVQWCVDNTIDGIVSDIVPFAFEVASSAGIPSIAVTNFTWWDIYEEYCIAFPLFAPYVEKIRRQYGIADMLMELMAPMPMIYFKKRKPVMPVGRIGKNIRDRLFSEYSLHKNKRLALIYTGNFGMDAVDWKKLEQFTDWEFLGLYPLPGAPSNYHVVSRQVFRYQDCIASVDLMISKIGYGVYAECLLNGTPILYLPREGFAEYPVLDRSIVEWGGGLCLSKDDFYGLDWAHALNKISSSNRPSPLKSDGAEVCAREIEQIVRRR
jgi:L-arabinokinase